jgi:hypothetical protein
VLAGCLASLEAADLLLTYLLLVGGGRPGVYEAYPLAAAVLLRHGWAGLAAFKALCSAVALAAALLVCRRDAAAGARLLAGLSAVMLTVVGYSGALLARSPAPVNPDGGLLDGRLAAVRRFSERRDDISLAVLEGREGLAGGVLRLRACLEEVGPALAAPARARLPDPGEPGQVASYLYHLCGLLARDCQGRQPQLRRLARRMDRLYPCAPRAEARGGLCGGPAPWRRLDKPPGGTGG